MNPKEKYPPHLKFSDTDGINVLFVATDPARSLFELTDFEPVEYISKDEHEALLKEAEARAFDAALDAVTLLIVSADSPREKIMSGNVWSPVTSTANRAIALIKSAQKRHRSLAGKERE